jgi:hypothetical protein
MLGKDPKKVIYASFYPAASDHPNPTWWKHNVEGIFSMLGGLVMGKVSSGPTSGTAKVQRFRTSLAEDICILNAIRQSAYQCDLARKTKNSNLCGYRFYRSNCEHWAFSMAGSCGVIAMTPMIIANSRFLGDMIRVNPRFLGAYTTNYFGPSPAAMSWPKAKRDPQTRLYTFSPPKPLFTSAKR